ncbi:MAG TPA: hypothetical protein VMH87_10375, partial [Pseudomonadales bacterium]|nr:hypothetical protein [Pseudomonadales bacterium]
MSDGESYHASDCESAEQADSTQNNPTDESAQKKTEPNISSGSSASTSSLAPAASNEQEAREKRKEGREEITLKLEIAGFFIGIIVGGIFLFQSCEMWKATNAATDQLAEMQRSREEDERAWVGISSIKPIFEEGSITGFQMNYKNTGK